MKQLAIYTSPPDARVELRHDAGPVFQGVRGTALGRPAHLLAIDGVPDSNGARLIVTRDGFVSVEQRGILVLSRPGEFAEFLVDDVYLTPAKASRPFPPESGSLRAVGSRLIREDGSVFQWRGATAFLAFARFWRGESIDPLIEWWLDHGVNVARVFAPGLSWGGNLEFYKPFSQPTTQVHEFFEKLAAVGVRCEWTVLTGGGNLDEQRRQLQWSYDVAVGHWNVMVEGANEPPRNSIDIRAAYQGVNRRGVLSASGAYPTDGAGDWDKQGVYVLDYCTPHIARVHDRKYARNSKDIFEIQQALDVPCVGDEPIGFGEWAEPGRRIIATPENIQDTIAHFGIAALFTLGCTIHFQAGIDAVVPQPDGQQEVLASAVTETWRRIPAEAQIGAYARPGFGDFPFEWREADSHVTHAYASVVGDQAWAVNPAPTAHWTAQTRPGWRRETTWPEGSMILSHVRRP